jgi:hypothetical protein
MNPTNAARNSSSSRVKETADAATRATAAIEKKARALQPQVAGK